MADENEMISTTSGIEDCSQNGADNNMATETNNIVSVDKDKNTNLCYEKTENQNTDKGESAYSIVAALESRNNTSRSKEENTNSCKVTLDNHTIAPPVFKNESANLVTITTDNHNTAIVAKTKSKNLNIAAQKSHNFTLVRTSSEENIIEQSFRRSSRISEKKARIAALKSMETSNITVDNQTLKTLTEKRIQDLSTNFKQKSQIPNNSDPNASTKHESSATQTLNLSVRPNLQTRVRAFPRYQLPPQIPEINRPLNVVTITDNLKSSFNVNRPSNTRVNRINIVEPQTSSASIPTSVAAATDSLIGNIVLLTKQITANTKPTIASTSLLTSVKHSSSSANTTASSIGKEKCSKLSSGSTFDGNPAYYTFYYKNGYLTYKQAKNNTIIPVARENCNMAAKSKFIPVMSASCDAAGNLDASSMYDGRKLVNVEDKSPVNPSSFTETENEVESNILSQRQWTTQMTKNSDPNLGGSENVVNNDSPERPSGLDFYEPYKEWANRMLD